MRTRTEVSAAKLRGAFYTPDALVDRCLQRICALTDHARPLRLIEPAAGAGAFISGIARTPALRERVASITALEPSPAEAEKAAALLSRTALPGSVLCASALRWAASTEERFDVAVGNPPFVRYQLISAADRAAALELASRTGTQLSGVSNLWIPVLLGTLARLSDGGAFAFVVPTECMTGVSAGALRAWLLRGSEQLQLDHFAPQSFPGVLQEVAVLSGRRRSPNAHAGGGSLRLLEHGSGGARAHETSHAQLAGSASWTRYLLDPGALRAYELASSAAAVEPLGSVARFEVSIVTGANAFFSVTDATIGAYALHPWARPLLPRVRHAPGLILTASDLNSAARAGVRTNLLDFSAERPDPCAHAAARAYLEQGAASGLATRYKCRIREPWFRVPGIRGGSLLLSKRSHEHPRVIVNEAGVLSTDTIYRGEVTGAATPAGVAAGFHNSLTLLSAELEGRSFGGGVLELVPSEIARLAFPVLGGPERELAALDQLARTRGADALVDATDALVGPLAGWDPDVLGALSDARAKLRDRRLARNRRALVGDPASRPQARCYGQ